MCTSNKTHSCPSTQDNGLFLDAPFQTYGLLCAASCDHSKITIKNFNVGCVVRMKKNRFGGMYILLETLNTLQTEHNVFNQGSHVAYREN